MRGKLWPALLFFFLLSGCRCGERAARPHAEDRASRSAARRQRAPDIPERGALAQKVLYSQAKSLLSAGRATEAEQAFRRALAADKDGAEAANCYLGIGAALGDQGRQAEAVAAYREVVRLRPADAEARRALAVGLEDAGDLEGAQRTLMQAIVLDADQLSAYQDLAALQLRAADAEGAKKTYERYEQKRQQLLALVARRGNADERLAALDALADARDDKTARALADALDEPDKVVRLGIIAALGRQGLRAGEASLRALLAKTEGAEERRAIELSLEAIASAWSADARSDGSVR